MLPVSKFTHMQPQGCPAPGLSWKNVYKPECTKLESTKQKFLVKV